MYSIFFRKKPDGLCVTCLFLGNNRHYKSVCAKTISCWVREVLCVIKACMSLDSLWSAAASVVIVAGVSLVSILQVGDWDRVSTQARHYFPTYITATGWHQDFVHCAVLGLSEKVLYW